MDETRTAASRFAILIGVFLLIEGIWGMFSPVVFGVLTTNMLHAAIHIVLGLVGIWTGMQRGSRRYLTFLGVLLVAVGALRFVPVASDLLVSLLNVNVAVACFNIVVGAVSLIVARTGQQVSAES